MPFSRESFVLLVTVGLAILVQQTAAPEPAEAAGPIGSQPSTGSSLEVATPQTENWLADVLPRPPAGVVRGSLTYSDGQVYYRLLDHASRLPAGELCRAAETPPGGRLFASLLDQPDRWQGSVLSVRGHVNRVAAIPAPENDFGIETLYELWLVTEDSQRYPTVLIARDLPPGMPIGESVVDGVSACGYFFKLHAYPARDGKGRLAPMVIVGSLDWTPPRPVPPPVNRGTGIGLLLALAAVLAAGLWTISRKPRRRRGRDGDPFEEPTFDPPPLEPDDQ